MAPTSHPLNARPCCPDWKRFSTLRFCVDKDVALIFG